MTNGEIIIDLSGDLRCMFSIDFEQHYDCKRYNCDYICRCVTYSDVRIEGIDVHESIELAHAFFKGDQGYESNFGFALATRFLKHLFTDINDFVTIDVVNGYYGEEIGEVRAEPNAERYFQQQCTIFNEMSNSERVKLVLEMEYGKLLPEVKKYDKWQLVQLPIDEVKANNNVLNKTSKEIVDLYKYFTPWYSVRTSVNPIWKKNNKWFPAVLAIPHRDSFRLIDGFHRYRAWTKKPQNLSKEKWKSLRTNKKIWTIIPDV